MLTIVMELDGWWNVMHDGNHGSILPKMGNKFMGGTIYVLAGNVQLASTTQCFTPHLH
jgi:hypothetical protein